MTARGVQGWQPDPFGLHEARYFSAAGEPTKLVRDRGAESYDEPPSGPDELAAARARMAAPPAPPVAYAPRGYVPVPSAYPPRPAYPQGPAYPPGPAHPPGPGYPPGPPRPAAARRARRGRASGVVGFTASAIILVAIVTGAVLVALTVLHPKKAGTSGAGDVALVTRAAAKTLQQRTADVVLSVSSGADGVNATMQGSGAIDMGGKAGTLDMILRYPAGVVRFQEIWVNGTVYLAGTTGGRSIVPDGKQWLTFPISTQDSGGTDLTGGNLTAALTSLQNQGIAVRALGTKVIGGVTCTGYSVTEPSGQAATTVTVWINPQNLVREITGDATLASALSAGASASPAPTAAAGLPAVNLTMDFTYSAVPVHVTAPPLASTVPSSVPS